MAAQPAKKAILPLRFNSLSHNTSRQKWEVDRRMWESYQTLVWFMNQDLEPNMPHEKKSILSQWLAEVNGGTAWKCDVPLDGEDTWCCHPHLKRFDRALAHVRSHLGLKPFPCEGRCNKDDCQERFNSTENRTAHWRGPVYRFCDICGAEVLRQNLAHHQAKCSEPTQSQEA